MTEGTAVESFQQQVVRHDGPDGPWFRKSIRSDYSWWTYERSDVYRRERDAHSLLADALGWRWLLAADDRERRLDLRGGRIFAEVHEQPSAAVIDALVDAVIECQRCPGSELDDCGLATLIGGMLAAGRDAGVDARLLDELAAIGERWRGLLGPDRCFVHGDLHLGNILVDGDAVVGLIDFEETVSAPPAFDVACLAGALTAEHGADCGERFRVSWARRSGRDPIPPEEWRRFCRLRGWIASRYLETCCPPELRERARNFIWPRPLQA